MSGKSERKEALQQMFDLAGPKVAEAFKRRHFEAYYVKTREEALELLWTLVPVTDTVGWGGTDTVQLLDIPQKLRDRGNTVIDRDTAKNMEERMAIMRHALQSDTFLMSANAISEDGQLVNVDGNGNRLAGLLFGPKSVIVLAGMNKVTKNADEAMARARHFAAPLRAQCFAGVEIPCRVTGSCSDCVSPGCVCAQLVTTRLSRPAGRIKVILIGEELGF